VDLLEEIIEPMLSEQPCPPNFYPVSGYPRTAMTSGEIDKVDNILWRNGIDLENTRIEKLNYGKLGSAFNVMQARSGTMQPPTGRKPTITLSPTDPVVRLVGKGDYCGEMTEIVVSLLYASLFAPDYHRTMILRCYLERFQKGKLAPRPYFVAQVERSKPFAEPSPVEIGSLGFEHTDPDPKARRGQWIGLVGILDPDQHAVLETLKRVSDQLITFLPIAPIESQESREFKWDKEPPSVMGLHGM